MDAASAVLTRGGPYLLPPRVTRISSEGQVDVPRKTALGYNVSDRTPRISTRPALSPSALVTNPLRFHDSVALLSPAALQAFAWLDVSPCNTIGLQEKSLRGKLNSHYAGARVESRRHPLGRYTRENRFSERRSVTNDRSRTWTIFSVRACTT